MARPMPQMTRIAPSSSQSMWKYSRRSNMSVPAADRRAAARVGILVVQPQVLVRRRRRQRLAVLLGEVGRQDVVRDRGGVGTVNAVFEEDDAGDRRIVARREEDEPAVVPQILPAARRRDAAGVRDHLRGPGLAADVVA